mgnify:CR=1 FL=1
MVFISGRKGLQAQKAQNGELNQVMFHEVFSTVILMGAFQKFSPREVRRL